ncbi:RNA pyrophosphohydrolase [Massilia sp. Bi118]|uniref:NUDIX domain-containing protein n=1 Tax=Massilia sp. Bi118 TaxID=2822346 RepID=UPI001DD116A4|nr:NUDIX domain-containing protein [Massilia sp. Bi118]CAH0157378.1 RNA pyrophosphohydrolase [Massilia sp. Bi118]
MLLYTLTHPDAGVIDGVIRERQAVRAVVLHGREILLLYTRRYNDYSFPGGGLDDGESPEDGLVRELQEETGATGIAVGPYLGYGDEYRPPQKAGHDLLFMRSHFYACRADRLLGNAAPEAYEVKNGMVPRWVDIDEAIAHNEAVLRDRPPSMGMSIQRETLMLKYVARHLLRGVP